MNYKRTPPSSAFVSWYKQSYGSDLTDAHEQFMEQTANLSMGYLAKIFQVINDEFNVTREDISSKTREREVVDARRIISRTLKGLMTQSEIGSLMGGLDHASIHSHWTTYEDLYKTDKDFRDKAERFKSHFNK